MSVVRGRDLPVTTATTSSTQCDLPTGVYRAIDGALKRECTREVI